MTVKGRGRGVFQEFSWTEIRTWEHQNMKRECNHNVATFRAMILSEKTKKFGRTW